MAEEESRVDKLIAQLKSNDVDSKVDALAKLQLEFESGVEIPDPDAVISAFKACLRVSHQHLTSATLHALVPLLPLLVTRGLNPAGSSSSSGAIDVSTLRYLLTSFLPPGGIIDRLGDRERPQAQAREALVILGGYAFRTSSGPASMMSSKSGKGAETPLMIYERFIKESGLASKVWKIREQSILTLVHVRRAHSHFPIRPYLTNLVDCLEDTDAHVRDCARVSVVELFSGQGATDAARADLKKEMSKKNVRKAIAEGVLAKLLTETMATQSKAEASDSERSSRPTEYIPPSMRLAGAKPRAPSQGNGVTKSTPSTTTAREILQPPSRATASSPIPQPNLPPASSTSEASDVQTVYIASARDLENEFAAMAKPFEGKETEHNWSVREQSIQRVRGMLKGDVHERYPDVFFTSLKEGFIQWSLKTLASLRTTVAINTCLLYSEMAKRLGHAMDPYCDILFTNLLKMASFTKKLTAQQSQLCVTDLITHTGAPTRVITLLWNTLQEKTVQARAYVVGHLMTYVEVHGARNRYNIESSGGFEVLEKCIKKALVDQNPGVRTTSRQLFWVFHSVWPDNAMTILDGLDGTSRKAVEKACPDPSKVEGVINTETPKAPKKSSVAAAIAASRAKARAIAAAPPSLRHQATSMSGSSAGPRRSTSPSLSTSPQGVSYMRPSSPMRTASSPGIPPSSRPRPIATRSVSSTTTTARATPVHGRSTSASRGRAPSPSLSDNSTGYRRRAVSPLASTPGVGGTLRKAIHTALPASPPSSVGQGSPPRPIRPSGLGVGARPGNRNTSGPVPVPGRASGRQSLAIPGPGSFKDESLLLATTVPIPEGDDSDFLDGDDDHSVNLMSFSAAYDQDRRRSRDAFAISPGSVGSGSKPTVAQSVSNALSSGSLSDMAFLGNGHQQVEIVEDALRARAEQAESAAERLLELVDDDDMMHTPMMPITMGKPKVRHSNASTVAADNIGAVRDGYRAPTHRAPAAPLSSVRSAAVPPATPNNRTSAVMKQAALFQDSPIKKGRGTSSLLDVLQAQRHETGWWLKRTTVYAKAQTNVNRVKSEADRVEEVKSIIQELSQASDDGSLSSTKDILEKAAIVCLENPVIEDTSPEPSTGWDGGSPSPFVPKGLPPTSLRGDIWERDRLFDKLFNALAKVLEPSRPEADLEYGLIVVWEMLENQAPHLEHRQAELFSLLLGLRYCDKINVLEATSTIRDALTAKIDPVYGVTTFHSCLKAFHAEEVPTYAEPESKASTYAFGLIALGKFILRLPAEIAEEELPRLKATLISALNDRSSLIVRESAAASIIAAQLTLRNETQLFALLDGLADDKKNLLTYLFDKHGARDRDVQVSGTTTPDGKPSGLVKFEKEIMRLDTRTSTPSRGARR